MHPYMIPLTSPLNVYIIWHPNFARGADYANYIYSELCRDYQKPLNRTIGIPVFFRNTLFDNGKPLAIDYTPADRNAVIVLVEDEMFEDDKWSDFFRQVVSDRAINKRVFPVALSKYAGDVAPEVRQQFIRLTAITDSTETAEFAKRCEKLRSELLHDLSRLMLNMAASYDPSKDYGPPPIKLFISHAKKDGEATAIDFRNYIRSETKLSSFFDASDIANGYDFEKEIAEGVKNSALVVFQTDAYSSREWCRIEVITAKRYKSPIVVVNAIESGEQRSFPYIGNVPSIRWNNNFDKIIDLALIQVLYNLYQEQLLKKWIDIYKLDESNKVAYLTSPPELFNYLDLVKIKKKEDAGTIVLYPDPPLGNAELKLLNELDDGITFTTPIMLPKYQF